MSLLSSLAGIATGGLGNAILNKATGGKIGVDPTPGFSATNVATGLADRAITAGSTDPADPIYGGKTDTHVLGATTVAPAPPDPYTAISTGSSIDPSTGLSYDQLAAQAQGQLGNLDQQAQVGNQNILDAYNTSYNALQGQKALTDRNYNTSKAQTLQDYTAARGNEQAQVGQQSNSLQRLLGAHGYQGSANTAAAFAAARQGSIQNQALEQGFGRNQQALDTNYGDYNNQFNSSLGDLGHQRDVQKNSLQAQVDTNKQSLLQQLSQIAAARGGNAAGYTPQINQLGQQITQLGQQYASPVIRATAPVYQAPNLESYATPDLQAAQVNNVPGATSAVNPYLSLLLGQQDKKNINNVGV